MSRSGNPPAREVAADPVRVARFARALADRRRIDLLGRLATGPATVNELAEATGLRPAETSRQLGRLRAVGLVRTLPRGRHRIYSADGDRLGRLLGLLGAESDRRERRDRPRGPGPPHRPEPGSPLQRARTCYDHLAGAAGVALADGLEAAGWVVRGADDFLLTAAGERALVRRGVDVEACRSTRRKLAPGCLDWTERRPHVGGALGAALLRALRANGTVETQGERRARLRRPIEAWFRSDRAPRSG